MTGPEYTEDELLGGVDDSPTIPIRPAQPNAPVPGSTEKGPAGHRTYTARHLGLVGVGGFVAAVAVLVGVVLVAAWLERPSPPNGVALGRAFRAPLAASLADSIESEAAAVEKQTPVAKANTDAKTAFRAALNKAFADGPASAFAKILPPESEPKDDAQRAEFVRLLRDFARGLKSR